MWLELTLAFVCHMPFISLSTAIIGGKPEMVAESGGSTPKSGSCSFAGPDPPTLPTEMRLRLPLSRGMAVLWQSVFSSIPS